VPSADCKKDKAEPQVTTSVNPDNMASLLKVQKAQNHHESQRDLGNKRWIINCSGWLPVTVNPDNMTTMLSKEGQNQQELQKGDAATEGG
jgi:hypothetical protein